MGDNALELKLKLKIEQVCEKSVKLSVTVKFVHDPYFQYDDNEVKQLGGKLKRKKSCSTALLLNVMDAKSSRWLKKKLNFINLAIYSY